MKLFSRIGEPFYSYSLEKQAWKKGEKIDGFEIPFNLFDSVHGIFRRFSLWQSSKGVCQIGVLHKPRAQTQRTFYNAIPILVGDKVQFDDGEMNVSYAENQYKAATGMWMCRIYFGFLPEPQVPEVDPAAIELLKNYCEVDETISSTFLDFFERFFKEVLPMCQVTTQLGLQNVVNTLALPQFSVLKEKFKSELEESFQKTRENLWH